MNILRLSTLSLTLTIAVFALAYSNPSFAGKKCDADPNHPSCKDGGGGGDDDKTLRAKFDLFIGTTGPQYILSDNGSYPNSNKDHVQVGTGSGPGFRFDTNTQNVSNLSRWMSARHVYMTVTGSPTPPILAYEIDFRFNQRIGLDLGSLDVGQSRTVAASLQYFGGNQVVGFDALNNGILGFGALNAATPPEAEDCLSDSGPITVTRTGPMQWELESPLSGMACRFAIDANGDIECSHLPCGNPPTIIPFKFKFTIDEQV